MAIESNPLSLRNIGRSFKETLAVNPMRVLRDYKTVLDDTVGREKSNRYFFMAGVASLITPTAAVIGVIIHEPGLLFAGTFFTAGEAGAIELTAVRSGKEISEEAEKIRKNPRLPGI